MVQTSLILWLFLWDIFVIKNIVSFDKSYNQVGYLPHLFIFIGKSKIMVAKDKENHTGTVF